MPALSVLGGSVIQYGTLLVQIVLQHGNPLRIGVICSGRANEGWRIFEIVFQGFFRSGIVGIGACDFAVGQKSTRPFGGVAHIDGHTAVVHECGHGGTLGGCTGIGVGITVEHIGPVVGGCPEIGGKYAVIIGAVVAVIGVAACSCSGPVVVFHKLCHSCGHAAHVGLVAAGSGAKVVVWGYLVPSGGDQGTDSRDGQGLRQVSGANRVP